MKASGLKDEMMDNISSSVETDETIEEFSPKSHLSGTDTEHAEVEISAVSP